MKQPGQYYCAKDKKNKINNVFGQCLYHKTFYYLRFSLVYRNNDTLLQYFPYNMCGINDGFATDLSCNIIHRGTVQLFSYAWLLSDWMKHWSVSCITTNACVMICTLGNLISIQNPVKCRYSIIQSPNILIEQSMNNCE